MFKHPITQSQFNLLKYGQHKVIIIQNLKIFSQNICKNCLFTNIILENNKKFDIIFIQEQSWSIIHTIPSISSKKGEEIYGASSYPLWIMFVRYNSNNGKISRVFTYINLRLSHL